jgi:hypothetical protein
VYGHGEAALAALEGEGRPQSVVGHSKVGRDGTPLPVPMPVRVHVRFRSPAPA